MYNRTTHRSKIDDLQIATKNTRASTFSCVRACAFIDLPSFFMILYDATHTRTAYDIVSFPSCSDLSSKLDLKKIRRYTYCEMNFDSNQHYTTLG